MALNVARAFRQKYNIIVCTLQDGAWDTNSSPEAISLSDR